VPCSASRLRGSDNDRKAADGAKGVGRLSPNAVKKRRPPTLARLLRTAAPTARKPVARAQREAKVLFGCRNLSYDGDDRLRRVAGTWLNKVVGAYRD
jgi:hypothetical protein